MFKISEIVIHEGLIFKIADINDEGYIDLEPVELEIEGKELLDDYMTKYSIEEAITRWFIAMKKITHGHIKSVSQANVKEGLDIIDKLMRLDGYVPAQIIRVLNVAITGTEFWADVVLTLTGIRVKKKGGNKFDKILSQLDSNDKYKSDKENMIASDTLDTD